MRFKFLSGAAFAAAAPATVAGVLLLALALAGGCDPFDPDLGDSPFRCGADGACPGGYSCQPTAEIASGVCIADDGEDSTDTAGDGDGDSSACLDASFEPNDRPADAVITMVPDSQLVYTEEGLAVCPAGDVDLFRFRVAVAEQNIRVEIATDRGLGELSAQITTDQGVPLASGTYNPSNTQLTVELTNAPADVYFLRVAGTAAETQNFYDVSLELSGP